MAPRPFPTQIVLTADAVLVAKLRRKLAEYDRRLAFKAPEIDPHATYKRWALKQLLERGCLHVDAMCAYCVSLGWFDTSAFEDAVRIIDAYNADDLSSVRGGTGLR